ncbi:membrane isoform B [Chlorella sorokiniana]|uniref:Membrane isoform B n=1 Tax=Chlorella sorokiniana TaxID=3076 RepID=A0A2P6TJQ8_CHLSO|nr:membrane isoform B [Chlorella sorokiniana]|eukprot:PRW44278.1 membrane isoform B [Chlorella sorokiniana]
MQQFKFCILLFLLLSFRNNAAFQRWQTGADRFNSFCDKNKNLARLIAGNLPIYTATNKSEAYRHCLGNIRWLMVGVEMARQTLRGVHNEHCLADLISDDAALEALMASPDPPLHCLLQVQTRERLFRGEMLNTPIPFAYISHLRTFMVLWLAVVPWVFVVYFDWYTMLLCAVIGYGVVGVEEAAVEVEQPFGADFNDIPLDTIVAQTHKTMAGIMRYIREEQRRAIAAGEIADSDDGEGGSTPGKLEQVVVSQDVTK